MMADALTYHLVIAGLVPAIHTLLKADKKGMDARDKRGHDES